jgi:hypothetical protein
MPGITINMTAATIATLMDTNSALVGFKAVQANANGALPAIWFSTQRYSQPTQLTWSDQFQGFASSSSIAPDETVMMSFSVEMRLGQTLTLSQYGQGMVSPGGPASAISIANQGMAQTTCGIAQPSPLGGGPVPYCAVPLPPASMTVLAPLDRVLLLFSTMQINEGTLLSQAFASGLLIDVTAAGGQCVVEFDIDNGWSAGGASWAQDVAQGAQLAPLLLSSGWNVAAFAAPPSPEPQTTL